MITATKAQEIREDAINMKIAQFFNPLIMKAIHETQTFVIFDISDLLGQVYVTEDYIVNYVKNLGYRIGSADLKTYDNDIYILYF